MGKLQKTTFMLRIVGELFGFLWRRKLWWLIPFVAILLIFGVLITIASVTPLGPFIYALF